MASSVKVGVAHILPFNIPATELSAGTTIEHIAPVDGYIDELSVIVQTAIVTGGTVTVGLGATPTLVAGLTVTVGDSATKGTRYTDTSTAGSSTRKVTKGDRIQIIPAAAFNGGGELRGFLVINSAPGTPA